MAACAKRSEEDNLIKDSRDDPVEWRLYYAVVMYYIQLTC